MHLATVIATASAARKAQAEGRPWRVLTEQEAAEFDAIAAQIIPTDDTPGAREAGAIHFIDQALAGVASFALPQLREGLAELQEAGRVRHGIGTFAGLSGPQQIELLQSIEDSEFFGTVRFLTVAGMFSDPEHGGNVGRVGWQLLEYEGPGATAAPYGHYDAEYSEKGA